MGIWKEITEQLQSGNPCVLISVLEKKGSAPREVGTRMLMRHDGTISGTIGGGQLEWEIMKHAHKRFSNPPGHNLLLCNVSLGPSIGQCCGGSMVVGIEYIPAEFLNDAQRYDRLEQTAPLRCRVTIKGDGSIQRQVLPKDISEPANENSSGKSLNRNQFVEIYENYRRPLYIFGAGHVGYAFMLTLGTLPFFVTWVDSRKYRFPKATPSNYRCVVENNPTNVLSKATEDSFVLIMTHSHAIDMEIVRVALLEEKFGFVGLIGSSTKRARFKKRLLELGVTEAQFDNLVCPIGIDGIGSKHPSSIAASTTAQLLIKNEEIGGNRTIQKPLAMEPANE